MSSESESLNELLEQLDKEKRAIPFSKLYALSDLSRKQLAEFRPAWEALSADTRNRMIHAMVELAEMNFEVNFDSIFRLALDDPDAQVRAMAIDGLWEDEAPDLIGAYLTMLRNDPSPQVRAAAATGLGRYVLAGELEKLEAPIQARITAELLTISVLAGESIEVRRRAIESAAYVCTPEVQDILELAYFDEDEKMRLSAVVGMGRSCDPRWESYILEELRSQSPAMRFQAAWASGELVLGRAVPLLARLIQDPDRQVTMAAIWALGQIGGPEAKQILTNAYDDADEDTEAALDEALAELALAEGELDLAMYDFGEDEEEGLFDDEFITLWESEEDQDDEDLGADDSWDLEDF
jgi:HEAT repeat protein